MKKSPEGSTVYDWRKMTPDERDSALARRQARRHPWHKPRHEGGRKASYHLAATCYEHQPFIGLSKSRMEEFEADLLQAAQPHLKAVFAWSILPNHYHLLLESADILELIASLGRLHGKKSYEWNKEEVCQGRQVWSGCIERRIRSERHFWATMNYVHHNPVRHQYVQQWGDWPYSSAGQYLEKMGKDEAARIWREYPILDYGKKWDAPDL